MKPASPPDPAELVHRMRQQLILVQVRIMELEDARDETGNRLAECQQLLRAAQTLADQKLDEAAHLDGVRAELQAECERLQQLQQKTDDSLNAARAGLAVAGEALATEKQAAAARGQRITELDAELRGLKASRSWRWSAWLRSLERLLGGRNS